MNDEARSGTTDWKAVFAAAGFFYISLTGIGWLFGEYLLGRVNSHIEEHTIKVTGERTRIFAESDRRAEQLSSRVNTLEQNCAVMQKWTTGVEKELSSLEHWRDECSQKMATVRNVIERDALDMDRVNNRLDKVEDLVSKGKRE